MALSRNEIIDIFRDHTYGKKRVLTWRGWRKVKYFNKTAALGDIWRAFGREFEEQRKFLEEEVARIRQQVEDAREKSDSDLVESAPGYVFQELRVLFRELEKELEGKLPSPVDSKPDIFEKIRRVLGQDHDEQLRIVNEADKDSGEKMERLRRRLERMAKDLQLSEAEVTRLRGELNVAYDSGVASVYKSVQGLSANESNVDSKRELLSKLFESNLELRKKLDKK